MIQSITIVGLASMKTVKIIPLTTILKKDGEELTLMDFLISNGIHIATSCKGLGICHKCFVNQSITSCQITLTEFINTTPSLRVEVSYL